MSSVVTDLGVSKEQYQHALSRLVARYARVPRRHRVYVSIKLRTDPILEDLLSLGLHFGDVLDAGCGRGQLSLALWELGLVRSLRGFDADAEKIAVAETAARNIAHYKWGDLTTAEYDRVDTVLLIDVLHYLPSEQQTRVLVRATRALKVGGRLLVRDVAAGRSWRSRFTAWCEHVGVRLGINRGHALAFTSPVKLTEELQSLGLEVCELETRGGKALDNVLLLARRSVSE